MYYHDWHRTVRPKALRTGRLPAGPPEPGEVVLGPAAAEIGPQGVAALAAAANGYVPANGLSGLSAPAAPELPGAAG